jgi:hypothetical protein
MKVNVSDCSSLEEHEHDHTEIKLKNKRVVRKETLPDEDKKPEDEPSAIGTWFKDLFMFCGTGNKGCLGKEKQPKEDVNTNYGGMESKPAKVKLQSFAHSHKKGKRRRSQSHSSSSSSEESDDSIGMKQKKIPSHEITKKPAGKRGKRKSPSRSSSSSRGEFEDLEAQYKRDEAKREKDRLLLKARLKEERKKKAEERKRIEKERKFHQNNPVGTKKKKTVTILDYRSPTLDEESSGSSSSEHERERRRKKKKSKKVSVHSESDEENSCYISDCSSLKK